MLRGDLIELRPVRERDLDRLYDLLSDLRSRGDYFPLGIWSESKLRSEFASTGLWQQEEGMLLMVDAPGDIVGEIEFFPISTYLVGYELSYQLFGPEHAGKGYTTEAVRLLGEYLFARKRINRLQLNIHPDNAASKRVAEKCGYTFEGIMRGCWFHQGRYHDLEIWSLLRDELAL